MLDVQAKAGRTIGHLHGDLEARGGALVLLQDAADLAVDLGGIERVSAASMRWLNVSCMACSLPHRSAERHRIAVSPVSGECPSLTSMPSRISRQPPGSASSAVNLRSSALGAPMM